MSDTRFPKLSARDDYDDLVDTPRHADQARSDDPLAELARLIEEDPFADFNQRRAEPQLNPQTAGYPQSEHAAEVEPEYRPDHAEEAADHRQPELDLSGEDLSEATDYDRDSTERLYADLAAVTSKEPRLEPASPATVPQAGADQWMRDTGYDPAAALEASLQEDAETGWAETEADAQTQPARVYEAPQARVGAYEEDAYAETDPEFTDTGHLPPYEGELPEAAGGRSRATLVVASLLGLVVVGGASALVYRGFSGGESDGPPPLIRADKGPTKVQPESSGDEAAPQQGKLVYDRVDSKGTRDKTRLVSREEPVADVGGRQVRVIDPNQEQSGLRGSAPDAGSSGAAADTDGLPKRVRTVVVKPDGTIVGEIQAPKPVEPLQPAPLPTTTASATAATSAPEPGQASAETTSTGASGGIPIPPPKPEELASLQPTVAPEPEPAPAPVAAAPAPAPAPEPVATQSQPGANFVPPAAPAPAKPKAGQPLSLSPENAASLPVKQQPAPAPTQVASAAPATTQAAAPAAQPSPFPAGSYVVQVAATRSEQDARGTAASINQRYASVLSGFTPAVERADLGDRGIYYRVGVGPMKSQGDANSLCGQLKSAGLDCFVRRN